MPFVAFEVAAATASHASRKPAAHADREGSTQFSDMLDKPDTIDQSAPKDQASPAQATSPPAVEGEPKLTPEVTAKPPVSPDAIVAEVQPAEITAAPDKPATEQEIADFLAAVAAATGMKITPVAPAKADEKPAKTKSDDKTDDATVSTDAAAPAETKSADAAAVVVTVQADTTAAAPEAAVAKSTGIVAVSTEQAIAPAVAVEGTVVPAETKDAKPKTAAKVDAPVVTPNLVPEKPATETKQGDTGLQPAQPAIQPQGQKLATDAPDQTAKPVPAHHDAAATDVAVATTKPADNLQPMVLLQHNSTTSIQGADQTALTPAPANTPQAVALPVAGIAVEIAAKALDGKNRFEIRLDPPELGKIHVRLDVDHKGEVTSIITADRSDTFDLLRRDAQALERALQDAGVKTANNGLQFSLRDQGTGRHDQPALADSARVIVRDDNLDTDIIAPVYRSFTGNRAGVDIRV